MSMEDVKFESDPVITTASSISIPHISTAGTSIITTAGSLMTKADMIGVVDDDDDDITDHASSGIVRNHGGTITIQVPRSRVGVVMDDDDDNDQSTVVHAVLVSKFIGC